MKRLLVIGGGLSGLSAAWHARRAGVFVRLLESAPQTGGVVQTYQGNGYMAEAGPNSLVLSSPAILDLLRALGLESEIVQTAPLVKNRFLVRGGVPQPVPHGPRSFLTSRLFSLSAKLRLLREWRIPARPANSAGEESLADFARRRFGPEALAYAFDPVAAGVYAGDPEKISVRHAFPRLHALETAHGSVLRGLRAQFRDPNRFRSSSISFRSGMAALPRALTAQLGDTVATGARLNSLTRDSSGVWTAAWDSPGHFTKETFDAVVLAVPAHVVARLPLPSPLAAQLTPLQRVEHPPLAVVVLGYPQKNVRGRLDGFGLLVPAVEPFDVLGVLFTSSLFPERAPQDHVTLTAFAGGARRPELAALDDADLLRLVEENLQRLLRVNGPPTYRRLIRWDRAIPQYSLQHGEILAALDDAEKTWPGLALAGSYRDGVSVTQCLETGRLAADRALNPASPPTADSLLSVHP